MNVSSLLMVHAERRKREIAMREALGASRSRIAAQLITEVIVLRARSRIGQMRATARVDGAVVAEGVFTYSMAPLDRGPGGAQPAGRPAGSDAVLREEAPRAGR